MEITNISHLMNVFSLSEKTHSVYDILHNEYDIHWFIFI